jgi:hypothetical protein
MRAVSRPRAPLRIAAAVLLGVSLAPSSNAETQACFDAALRGQKLEREGKLLAARDIFVSCAQQSCPEAVMKQCTAWAAAVNDVLPTVVLGARDDHGRDLTDVTVTVDDQPATLQGRGILLDPGRHTLRWRRSTGAVLETSIVLREHEKGRHVEVTFSSPSRSSMAAAYVLAGTAVVAAGLFSYFGLRGHDDWKSLGCDQHCTPTQGAQVRREFVVADVALGVAALSAAGAIWLFLTPAKDDASRQEGWFVRGAVARF